MKPKTERYLAKLSERLDNEYLAMRALHFSDLPAWKVAIRAAGMKFSRKKNPTQK
jgi:hypothetical protein